MFRSIIVPIDIAETELSAQAVNHAANLARQSGGRLTLINVVPIIPSMMLDTLPVSFETEIAEKAKESLSAMAHGIDLPPERVEAVVRVGSIYHEVLELADSVGADLIVVGSFRPGMASYLIGSNATAIVRHADCSVLVLRQPEAEPAPSA